VVSTDTRAAFLRVAGSAFASLKLPVDPEKGWKKLARELRKM
jgi:hypothetical protein